jgi:T4 superinfection immunity protein
MKSWVILMVGAVAIPSILYLTTHALLNIEPSADGATAALMVFAWIFTFIPAFVANAREHKDRTAIVMLVILLGWSGIGWVIALVWAFTGQPHSRRVSQ